MPPEAIVLILQIIAKYGPAFGQKMVEIYHKKDPTLADWTAAFATVDKSYDDYVKGA